MKFFLGYLMLLGLGLMTSTIAQQSADRARLRNALYQMNDRELLPSYDSTNLITLGMRLMKIRGLDLFEGTIQMNVWMHMFWRDPRLEWYPDQFGNITEYQFPASDIWKPDITLYNGNTPMKFLMDDVYAAVYNHGTVFYGLPMLIDATCTLDLKDYPYDTHNCSLKWGSWAYNSALISVSSASDEIGLSAVENHPLWDIIDTKAIKHTRSYPCCPDEVYEDVTFSVTVRRRETHGRIATSVITTWLILIVFLIGPSSAGKRIFFAGFIFVALVVLSAALSVEIPGYSMTRLGRFLIGGMLIVAIVSIINGLIYRCYPKEKPGQLLEGDGSPSRALLIIDVGAFLGTAIILGISTGALFV